MAQAITQERLPGCALLTLGDGQWAFNTGAIAAGQDLEAGTVMARYQNKYYQLLPGAPNTKKDAYGVLYDNVETSAGEIYALVLAQNCEVKAPELVWPEGISDNAKAQAIEQLAERGVLVR